MGRPALTAGASVRPGCEFEEEQDPLLGDDEQEWLVTGEGDDAPHRENAIRSIQCTLPERVAATVKMVRLRGGNRDRRSTNRRLCELVR